MRWLPVGVIALLAGLFAFLNRGEAVALDLGFVSFYQVALVPLIFLAFVLGMILMFLLGLGQDLRVRRELRARGFLDRPTHAPPAPPEYPPPPVDPM